MIEECPDCGAVVGKDILNLPHICSLSDKLRKSFEDDSKNFAEWNYRD